MKKTTVAVLFALTFFTTENFAQTVVVTDDNTYVTGQASSVLDVKSISKGFLAPRMTAAQRVAILAPAEGLLVYQIDATKGFYYYTNSAWTSLSSSSGSAWSLTGNSGTSYPTNFLGTTDLQSLRFQTNSVQGLLLDSLGNMGVGLNPGFTPGTFREKFLVDAGTTGSYNAIVGRGSINNYLQLNIQNLSNGTSASSDVVATADNGNETVNYVDLGINSSTNTQNVMGAADDAYLYTTGNNFLIGTGTAAKALVFMTGGTTQSTNERMRIDGSGNVGIGTASPAYKLQVSAASNPLSLSGVQTGLSTDSILTIIGGVVRKLSPAALAVSSSNAWALIGNSGTNPASDFLGTIDAQPLIIRTSNVQVGRFDPNSLALGLGSTINNATNSYAFGSGANVGFNHVSAMALGNNAAINNDSSFAFGTAAVVNGQNSFAIGAGATANGLSGFALGRNSAVGYSHTAGMAIGNGAAVNSDSSFAIGPISVANVANSFAIGAGAASDGIGSLTIGRNAITAYGSADAIAIGGNASANAASSIAIGGNSNATNKTQANGASSIALGITALANSANAIAIGTGATVAYTLTTPSIAIGTGALSNGANSLAIGTSATTAFVANASALGANTSVSGANSTAIGYNTTATKANEVLLGDLTNSSLSVGIGSENFSTTNREKLLVDAGTTSSVTAILGRGTLNNYLQLNIQNLSNGTSASSDVVATADNGTELINYVDMGINSSTNTQNVMGAANDAYLYTTGNNFLIGTGTAAKALVFMTGGTTQSTNERMRIDGTTGFVGIGTTAPATALHVIGTNPLTLTGVQTGALSDSMLTIASGTVRKLSLSSLAGTVWSLTGNAGTSPSTNFLGTTDNQSLVFKANNQLSGKIDVALDNTLFGYQAGQAAITGNNNTYIGYQSGYPNTSGQSNTAVGSNAMVANIGGSSNAALGYAALKANTTGGSNAAFGNSAGLTNTTGSNNTFLGTNADATTAGLTNAGAVGANAKVATSNSLVLGGTGANAVNVGIGTTSPVSALHVVGTNPLTLIGVQTGVVTDSILTITAGTVRKLAPSALAASTSWSLTGNTGTNSGTNFLGTTDLKSLRFKTNAAQGMVLDSLGNMGIGASPGFTAGTFQEKLLVDAGTTSSFNAIVGRGTINNYLQLNIQNLSNGTSASSDVVATADNGTESVNYVDLGINSSTNTQNVMGAADDAYLYTTGNNLLIGTATAAKALVFMTGGTTQSTNERMRIDGTTGFMGIGTTAPATALHVVGTNPLTLVGIQSGAATDSILTINGSGTVRKRTIANLIGGGSSLTVGSIPFIGTAGTLVQNNASLFWDSTDSRLGVGTNTPSSDLTLFQSAGVAGPSRGFRFTGNSIGGTNTGSGFSMSLGFNVTGNKQLWLGDADYLNNSAGTFIRYTSSAGSIAIDAVNGNNTSRRAIALAVAGDPASGVILGNDGNFASPASFVWANGNMSVGNGYRGNAAPANGLIVQGNVGIGTVSPATALHVVGTNPLTLNGVQVGATSDSILTIASGTVRKLSFSTLTSGASWSLTGNAGTNSGANFLGTTDLTSLRFKTNAAQGLVLDSLGNVGIGVFPGFTTGTFQEKLLIDAGTTSSFNAIVARGTINNYFQLNIQNKSNGNTASSDVVATADNGTESVNYVDLGINGSGNTQTVFGNPDDAYLYTTGNNFLIGTATAGQALVFMTGGTTQSTNERMRIDGSGNVMVGKTSAAYKVDVHGKGNFDSTLNAPNYTSDFQTLTFGATTTWDQTKGATAAVTLTANATLSITNVVTGMYGLVRVTQDATGSRTLTLPAGSKVINGGGGVVALTTTAGATDVLSYFYDGTNYYWTIGYNYN
jgi:predicted transcriptional regulator